MRMKTLTGEIDFDHPEHYTYPIEDIAAGLAKQCRYNGQFRGWYSVAQHSVILSYLVEPAHAKEAMLHDASEAFIGDMIRPVKNILPDFREIENRIQKAIHTAHGLPFPISDHVKDFDNRLLVTEMKHLDMCSPEEFGLDSSLAFEMNDNVIASQWPWSYAEQKFLERWDILLYENRLRSTWAGRIG